MPDQPWYQWQGDSLILNVRVQPRASRDEVVGQHGEQLKIRLTAPPIDGKANQQLLKFLATLCDVPGTQVELLSGAGARNKRIRVDSPRKLPLGVLPPET